jgi:DNA-binding CsgD family transcriptional regulator
METGAVAAQSRRSVLIPLARVRRLTELAGEAAELARSTTDPQRHLTEGLVQLVDCDLGIFAPMPRHMVPGANTLPLIFTDGCPEEMRRVTRALYQDNHGSGKDPLAMAVIPHTRPGHSTVGLRQDFVRDREWYRSPFVSDFRRPQRHDHSIYTIVKAADGRVSGVALCRAWGAKPFSEADCALMELFVATCGERLFPAEPACRLSPRQREVRRWLLDGLAPKEIAAQIGISVNTVNEYITGIYRAEGVSTRAELLARALRSAK